MMTLREVIELMTDVVCKSDAELIFARSQFSTKLALCQDDMKQTVAAYRAAKRSGMPGVNSFNKDYITLFLTKFNLVDKMIDKLVSTATPSSENPVTEEEFQSIKLDDIGIDYIPQGPKYVKLWTNSDMFIGDFNLWFRAIHGKASNSHLANWPDTMQSVLTVPLREMQFCGNSTNYGFMEFGVRSVGSSGGSYRFSINAYRPRPIVPGADDDPGQCYSVGTILVAGSSTLSNIITDNDPDSPNPGAQIGTFRKLARSFTILDECIAPVTLSSPVLAAGSSEEEVVPPVPPLVTAPSQMNAPLLTDIGIKYWNESQAIFDFTRFLNGNFGPTPATNTMNGLMDKLAIARDAKMKAEAEMLDSWMDRESKELSDPPILATIAHPRRLEMLASLYAVKFAIFKIMYGHARRIK